MPVLAPWGRFALKSALCLFVSSAEGRPNVGVRESRGKCEVCGCDRVCTEVHLPDPATAHRERLTAILGKVFLGAAAQLAALPRPAIVDRLRSFREALDSEHEWTAYVRIAFAELDPDEILFLCELWRAAGGSPPPVGLAEFVANPALAELFDDREGS